jgi:hypothetical protein
MPDDWQRALAVVPPRRLGVRRCRAIARWTAEGRTGRWVAAVASPLAGHAAEVSTTFDRGVASLAAHRTYLDALGGAMADPATFLRDMARADAERLPGARLATAFELIPV